MEKVIFLDIDGVLNTAEYLDGIHAFEAMNPVIVAILRHLVESTKAVIVISSTWRHGKGWEERVRRVFSQSGWNNPPILDKTPDLPGGRGKEIATWLSEHSVTSFVIVDDDIFDMLPEQQEHIVHCDMGLGFTKLHAQEIKRRWA